MVRAVESPASSLPERVNDVRTAASPSLVLDFCALFLLGPYAMALSAAAAAVAQALASSSRSVTSRRALLHIAIVIVAALAAGFAHIAVGGVRGYFIWPQQAWPVAVALVVYWLISVGPSSIATLTAAEPRHRTWALLMIRSLPAFVVSAAVAAVGLEIVERRAWDFALLGAAPLYLAWQSAYAAARRSAEGRAHREELVTSDQPTAMVDRRGRVTLWNPAIAELLGCAPAAAFGRLIGELVPPLGAAGARAELSYVIHQGGLRTDLELKLSSRGTVLTADLLPDIDGAIIVLRDVTMERRQEEENRQDLERLSVSVEGANDGLWTWDRHAQALHVSKRWWTLLGLAPQPSPARPEDWFDRVHPDDLVSLKETIDAHLAGRTERLVHEHRMRLEDGRYEWFQCRAVSSREGPWTRLLGGSLANINEQAGSQDRIQKALSSDALTGLCNRATFLERVGKALANFKQRHNGWFAVLYLDLDRFKIINDSLGHLVGDELLIAVSRRLESYIRPADALARLGGDEFAILVNGLADAMQANVLALRIQDALQAPFSIAGREVFVTVSIGIACSRAEHDNAEEVLRDADTAMYHAKARGKARHELFDADMRAKALDRLGLESDLRHAVKDQALEMHYQPIVSLTSGMCVGFEALVRWKRSGKAISPADFIPLAEELGLIETLGEWVLQQSCHAFTDWRRRYPGAALDCITVNVSARQLMQQGFINLVERTVEETGMQPRDLRLEITETALMHNPQRAAEVLHGLREFGVKIYLDDFGTGYSSLSHLHKLPVDALKIDRSFVRSLLLTDRPAIVESILALARTLDTGVVAEGVESEQQARELERLGCRHAQGFFFSRPLTASAVDEILQQNRPLGGARVYAYRRTDASVSEPALVKRA